MRLPARRPTPFARPPLWPLHDRVPKRVLGNHRQHWVGAQVERLTAVVMKADDQLRQRVAWALSQVLVISHEGVGTHRKTGST